MSVATYLLSVLLPPDPRHLLPFCSVSWWGASAFGPVWVTLVQLPPHTAQLPLWTSRVICFPFTFLRDVRVGNSAGKYSWFINCPEQRRLCAFVQ